MTMNRIFQWLPALAAIVVLFTAGPLFWSRDFGNYLFAFFIYIPALLFVLVGLLFWAFFEKQPKRRHSILATIAAIIASSAVVFAGEKYLGDRIAFTFWYPFHHQLVEKFSGKDAIIITWDSWGMAGMENDSYLVSNPSDTISSTDAATRWAHGHRFDCEIVDVQRMRRSLYILTTYNCPLQ